MSVIRVHKNKNFTICKEFFKKYKLCKTFLMKRFLNVEDKLIRFLFF